MLNLLDVLDILSNKMITYLKKFYFRNQKQKNRNQFAKKCPILRYHFFIFNVDSKLVKWIAFKKNFANLWYVLVKHME